MPIDYVIDHEHRIVRARVSGVMSDDDVFTYQSAVWSRPDVLGYDELVDMSEVHHIALPSLGRIRDLANLSVQKDHPERRSKFAIVAPGDVSYMMGRLYKAIRNATRGNTRTIGVFHSLPEALKFLGLES
jgi:hypothetical protein